MPGSKLTDKLKHFFTLPFKQIILERCALERERKKHEERLQIATKNLKNALVKENMRQYQNSVKKEEERKITEYGKVIFVEQHRQREDQIRRVEQKRRMENMEKRRENSEKIKNFYAPKYEETAADSEDEEDEILDIHKQKSEVIFWNDPRIGMTKKDIHLSTLVRSDSYKENSN